MAANARYVGRVHTPASCCVTALVRESAGAAELPSMASLLISPLLVVTAVRHIVAAPN
jgi:hypothetical protein